MTFGTPVDEAVSIRLVHAAIDLGINFIDTANVYEGYRRYLGSPGGVAEEIVGKALSDRRSRVVLATKVGAPLGPGPQDRGLSAVHILRELEMSLRRLKTDVIDLYIMHWPDRQVPLETSLCAMDLAVRQGKVRAIGASNHAAWQLCELLWLAHKHHWAKVASSQIPFSLLRREWQHDLTFCQQHDIGVTPYQALQGGLLTGKYRRNQALPSGSRAADKPEWLWPLDEALFARLEALEELSQELAVTQTAYSLAWALGQPAITSLVVGATRVEQIEEAVAAASLAIPPEHLPRIDRITPPPWKPGDPVRG